jgi:hypothetical protein
MYMHWNYSYNNRCLFFRRLKINHESHEFILESGTVANNDVCHCEDKKRKHSEIIPGDPLMVGGEKGVRQKLWRGVSMEEERWLNGSTPDCKSVVLGSNPAPRQHTANSISTEVDSHLG